jgi:hypothetical protein
MMTSAGAQLHWQPVHGRWPADVPIPEAEQRHVYGDHRARGKLMLTARLRVFVFGPDRFAYLVAGPNIRQDGTPGALALSRDLSRDDPAAWAALVAALGELAAYVRADADVAAAEIARACASAESPADVP